MYRLLLTKRPFYGLKISQRFIQAKMKYEESMNYAIGYYNDYQSYLPNQHILVKLINTFSFDPDMLDVDIYWQLKGKEDRYATAFGFVGNSSIGKIHGKAFYTKNCVIRNVNFYDPINIPHWKHIRAVRVLTHPYTNLKPVLPHLFKTLDDSLYSVVGIDIPLLGIQYKYWLQDQLKRPVNEREQITSFITRWVMPNMFPEQIDIALRNRLERIGKELTMSDEDIEDEQKEILIKPPFYMLGWDNEFDNAFKELIEFYNKGERKLTEICIGMPMFSAENYYEAIPNCLDGMNTYTYWSTLLVYCDWYYPLVTTFDINPQQEQVYNNLLKVQRYIKGTRSDQIIPENIKERYQEKFDAIMTMWT